MIFEKLLTFNLRQKKRLNRFMVKAKRDFDEKEISFMQKFIDNQISRGHELLLNLRLDICFLIFGIGIGIFIGVLVGFFFYDFHNVC